MFYIWDTPFCKSTLYWIWSKYTVHTGIIRIYLRLLLHIHIWHQEWHFPLLSEGILSSALFWLFVSRINCKDTFTIQRPFSTWQKSNHLLTWTLNMALMVTNPHDPLPNAVGVRKINSPGAEKTIWAPTMPRIQIETVQCTWADRTSANHKRKKEKMNSLMYKRTKNW